MRSPNWQPGITTRIIIAIAFVTIVVAGVCFSRRHRTAARLDESDRAEIWSGGELHFAKTGTNSMRNIPFKIRLTLTHQTQSQLLELLSKNFLSLSRTFEHNKT